MVPTFANDKYRKATYKPEIMKTIAPQKLTAIMISRFGRGRSLETVVCVVCLKLCVLFRFCSNTKQNLTIKIMHELGTKHPVAIKLLWFLMFLANRELFKQVAFAVFMVFVKLEIDSGSSRNNFLCFPSVRRSASY